MGDKKVGDDIHDDSSFGWECFTLSSRKAKEKYLLVTLMRNIPIVNKYEAPSVIVEKLIPEPAWDASDSYSDDEDKKPERRMNAELVLSEFADTFKEIDLNEEMQNYLDNDYDFGHIDHQSQINLPIDQSGQLNFNFIKKLFAKILENNFVILGGNDNDGEHSLGDSHIEDEFSRGTMTVLGFLGTEGNPQDYLCVEDKMNNDFILHHRNGGHKIRMSFEINPKKTKKSGIPELVDLKLTNYCAYGCSFCYQSSTKEGRHADVSDIERIIDILKASGCFELAIGGGEPTTHPHFARILDYAKNAGMTVGFTTRNFDLYNHKHIIRIMEATSSIAFSCHNVQEIQKISEMSVKIQNLTKIWAREKIYIQIIPELYSTKKFEEMLTACSMQYGLKVTLLGYKEFGFGKSYEPKNLNMTSKWIDVVKELTKGKNSNIKVGIDSVLVKKWKKELLEKGCNKLMLVGEEGKFSCYVDAVEKTIAKSSFVDENEPLNLENSDILASFKNF
jgi:organic radical activating enzyme